MGLLTARPSSAKFAAEDPCFLDVDEYPEWQSQFGNSQPIKLEIGFGMGDFLIEMATREPHSNFVGIDFSQNGIRKIMARIKNLQLNNIRVVYGDVREKIPLLFENGELDTVYINFPDPWPKKRHFKRRLIKPALVKLIARKLAPAGHVYLATDSEPYALEILEYFNAEPLLQNVNPEPGFFADRDHLPKTKYEKNKELFEDFWTTCLDLGRLPADDEFEFPDAIRQIQGSSIKAFNLCKQIYGEEEFLESKHHRKEDLLVYFALSFFNKRREVFSRMPQSLQRDIKQFFGKYSIARDLGKEVLFSVADIDVIYEACIEAHRVLPASELNGQHDLIFHKDLKESPSPNLSRQGRGSF